MTFFLGFDTETTGLPLWSEPSEHPGQPHLVQFAAVLLDQDGAERTCVSAMVRPDGWTIPAQVTALHGISTDMATAFGIPERTVVKIFLDLVRCPDVVVGAHNASFDWRIMRIAMLRHGMSKETADQIATVPQVCTMRLADKIMRLPPTAKMRAAGINKSKAPNLMEAHQHFLGEPFQGAHDALADVRACARVWRAIQALETTGALV